MKDLANFFKKHIFLLILFAIELLLFLTNYKNGTYFVGWDNLFPELNFPVNFERSFFGIWQEYRGLGLLDGMSFAANFPHYLFLNLLSFFLPQNMLRFIFIFLMHFLGGVGMYFLLEREILTEKAFLTLKRFVSFFGAVFYLFNLATIQMFYAPYELFTVHFAFLPWLCLFLLKYLKTGSLPSLILFGIFSVFAVPQAHVPTVFIVYCLLVAVILFSFIVRRQKYYLRRSLAILLIIFACNAFWGLPYLYSAFNNQKIIINAKINQMSGEDVYLKNKARGGINDILLLKGFMLDMVEPKSESRPDFIMLPWRKHIESPLFLSGAYLFAGLALFGILLSLANKKRMFLSYLFLFIFSFSFLAIDAPLLGSLNDYLREHLPLFRETFRFSFTKFSIIFVFCYTLFLSYGLFGLILIFLKRKKKISQHYYAPLSFLFFLIILFTFYSYPAFKGNFLFADLKNKIPSEYFQAFQFLKLQDKNTRIALFPQPTFWSWRFYTWGSRGSGFLWYGIDQPTLDRSFDPWSSQNENYYWEISYALYSKNLELFENLLEKYQINWLLIDEYFYNPTSYRSLYFEESKKIFNDSKKIALAKDLGKIKVYQVSLNVPVNNFVFLAENIPAVGPKYQWNNFDRAYLDSGHYLSENSNFSSYYPFRSLFTGRKQEEIEFVVEEKDDFFVFSKKLPETLGDYSLVIPEREKLPKVNPADLSQIDYLEPEVNLDNNEIKVLIPKVGGYSSAQIDPSQETSVQIAKNCNQLAQGAVKNEIVAENGISFLRLKATNAYNCSVAFWLPNLPHKFSYLITAESKNIKGRSLLFWLENLNIRKADIETYLPQKQNLVKSFFIQPPMEEDGLGYSLHFDNSSIGNQEVINDLGKITVDLIPYKFLTGIKLVKKDIQPEVKLTAINASHSNPSLYEIPVDQFEDIENTTLVLSQAFHQGWQAYLADKNLPYFFTPVLGEKIEDHVLVNNWQNGWKLDNLSQDKDQKIVILFWPQFLEFLGFGILILVFGYFLVSFLKKKFSL